jgi:hypothetical protein
MPSRREIMRSLVAAGGASALSACTAASERTDAAEDPDFPQGDPDSLPARQHAWGKYIVRDARLNPVFPQHQVILFLDYVGDGPTDEERERVEAAFGTLERAFQWGTGGNQSAAVNSGLLFSAGYAPSYFERVGGVPDSVDLPPPEQTLRELDADPAKADPHDAMVHLGSDYAEIVLAAEEALFGRLDTVNGVEARGGLDGVFEQVERRAGFVGRGLPREKLDNENIPEKSPISMGFKSVFRDAFPSEDRMTLEEGPFAEGTVFHISRLELDLDPWYERSDSERVQRMFGASYTTEEVGPAGDNLGSKSRITEQRAEDVPDDAREEGVVGHTQKLARARNDDFEPLILRRGDFNAVPPEDSDAGSILHFGAIQRGMEDFVETRKAMKPDFGDDELPDLPEGHDGILNFIEVTNRANFLIPTRAQRALPQP